MKSNRGGGYMKKVFLISLLLVIVFLIGSSGVALASCDYLQDYRCTVTKMQYGVTVSIFSDCMQLCYVGPNVYLYDPFCVYCYLYPVTGDKYLLGNATTLWGLAGCYVELKGRSLTARLTFIEENQGYVDIIKCTPCDGCYPCF